MSHAIRVQPSDIERGYVICGCEKYAVVLPSFDTDSLEDGYYGEMCGECNMLVVSVDKIREEK